MAIAESAALSEWKQQAETVGCLDPQALRNRAAAIEKLLSERGWRETLFRQAQPPIMIADGLTRAFTQEEGRIRVISDVFYEAAKLYLATVVYGPLPQGELRSGRMLIGSACHCCWGPRCDPSPHPT